MRHQKKIPELRPDYTIAVVLPHAKSFAAWKHGDCKIKDAVTDKHDSFIFNGIEYFLVLQDNIHFSMMGRKINGVVCPQGDTLSAYDINYIKTALK